MLVGLKRPCWEDVVEADMEPISGRLDDGEVDADVFVTVTATRSKDSVDGEVLAGVNEEEVWIIF